MENTLTGEFHCGAETLAQITDLLQTIGCELFNVRTVSELYQIFVFSKFVEKDVALLFDRPKIFQAIHGDSEWSRYIHAVCSGDFSETSRLLPKCLSSIAPQRHG